MYRKKMDDLADEGVEYLKKNQGNRPIKKIKDQIPVFCYKHKKVAQLLHKGALFLQRSGP